MDGTLTMPVHDFNAIRGQLGIPVNTPILEAIKKMPAQQAKAIYQKLHDLEMALAELATPQPGVVELLQSLKQRGYRLGILTRNGEEIAKATLDACGLMRFFDKWDVIGRDTCAPKPLPDGVHHLLARWDADPNATVMVGDYLYDVEAGYRAGVHTVHFDASGVFPWPEFTHHRVQSMGEIQQLF